MSYKTINKLTNNSLYYFLQLPIIGWFYLNYKMKAFFKELHSVVEVPPLHNFDWSKFYRFWLRKETPMAWKDLAKWQLQPIVSFTSKLLYNLGIVEIFTRLNQKLKTEFVRHNIVLDFLSSEFYFMPWNVCCLKGDYV